MTKTVERSGGAGRERTGVDVATRGASAGLSLSCYRETAELADRALTAWAVELHAAVGGLLGPFLLGTARRRLA